MLQSYYSYTTTKAVLLIQFSSDGSGTDTGFSATWRTSYSGGGGGGGGSPGGVGGGSSSGSSGTSNSGMVL